MSSRVKRTYNLAPQTVRRVRELADDDHVAPSQDAVIELAVDELDRRLRDAREADIWEAAASDRTYLDELEDLTSVYGPSDQETWPR